MQTWPSDTEGEPYPESSSDEARKVYGRLNSLVSAVLTNFDSACTDVTKRKSPYARKPASGENGFQPSQIVSLMLTET